jgi:hypothetical protein
MMISSDTYIVLDLRRAFRLAPSRLVCTCDDAYTYITNVYYSDHYIVLHSIYMYILVNMYIRCERRRHAVTKRKVFQSWWAVFTVIHVKIHTVYLQIWLIAIGPKTCWSFANLTEALARAWACAASDDRLKLQDQWTRHKVYRFELKVGCSASRKAALILHYL